MAAAQVPDWRRIAVDDLTTLSSEELAASLLKSSAVVDLYNERFSTANSYAAVTGEMDNVRDIHRNTIRKQREISFKLLAADRRTKSLGKRYWKMFRPNLPAKTRARFERRWDAVVASLVQRTAHVKKRSRLHDASPHYVTIESWAKSRKDLDGLPFQDFDKCELEYSPAVKLRDHSAAFRRLVSSRGPTLGPVTSSAFESSGKARFSPVIAHLRRTKWKADDIPALVQILQVESEDVRRELVSVLSRIVGSEATVALARRALFDPSQKVRDTAVATLVPRKPDVYRPVLLEGFRYPWAPAADQAAQALVTLKDHGAVADLERLLTEPNPSLPVKSSDGHWSVRELVRVNHMRNCYLCHAPSLSEYDTARGFVPSPSDPLPRIYYNSRPSGYFVRADVTYLRQDFSTMHTVKDAKPWPQKQRFDYLVRERPLSEQEANDIRKSRRSQSWPQRNAVVYALQALSRRKKPVSHGSGVQ